MYHASLPQPPWGPFTMLSEQQGSATLLWFSPLLQFLDVISIDVVDICRGPLSLETGRRCASDSPVAAANLEATNNLCEVHATSCSTTLVPAWIPGALLWSVLFCWLPLCDGGQNKHHLDTLRNRIEHGTAGKISAVEERMIAANESRRWLALVGPLGRVFGRVACVLPPSLKFFLTYCVSVTLVVLWLVLQR